MIVVQIAAGVVLAVWGLSSAAPAAVTGVVAAIVIAGWWCCTQIREARSFWTRILFHINGSRVSVGIPVEFADIPATGGPLTDTLVAGDAQARTVEGIGVSVSPDVLVTVIRVRPASPAVRYLDRTGRDCGPGTEPPLALAPLADCLAQFDIALHSIDVVVHTAAAGASGPVSHSYARTLGPIRSTPRTSTFVIVRLDPRNCPEAITRRGGNTEGTARTVAVATRRVAARVTERGLAADILSAAEIPAVLRELTGGLASAEVSQSWGHAYSGPLWCRTVPLDQGGAAQRYSSIDAAVHPAAANPAPTHHRAADHTVLQSDTWARPTAATTTVIGLTGTASAPCVRVITRIIDTDRGTDDRDDGPADTHALCGHQAEALLTGLPHPRSHTAWRHVAPVLGAAARQLIQRIALPCSGSGQLLGADPQGRPVALTLAGPGVSRVVIDARRPLAAQIVLRAIATGAQVVVHTDDPHRWRPMQTAVDRPDRLSLAPANNLPVLPARVEVYDGPVPPPDSPGVTIFQLCELADESARPGNAPATTVLIRQDRRNPHTFSVDTHTGRTVVSIVAVDDEWAIINGRRGSAEPPRTAQGAHLAPVHAAPLANAYPTPVPPAPVPPPPRRAD